MLMSRAAQGSNGAPLVQGALMVAAAAVGMPRTEGTLRGSSAAQAALNAIEEAMVITAPETAMTAAVPAVQAGGGFTKAVVHSLVMQLGVHAATALASQLANATCPKRAPQDTAAKEAGRGHRHDQTE